MGSKAKVNGSEVIYRAASAWVDRALKSDDSLFLPANQSGRVKDLASSTADF